MKMTRLTLTLLIATLSAGCAGSGFLFFGDGYYEERTRIFYAYENRLLIEPNMTQQEIARRYAPTAVVNAAFEELGREGFTLHSIEPLPRGAGASLFLFRRPIPRGERRRSIAPSEYEGLFSAQAGAGPTSYYLFFPRYQGYTIHMIAPTQTVTFEADWDGERLKWQQGDVLGTARLTEDSRSMVFWLNTVTPTAEDPINLTFEARRVGRLN